MLNRHHPSRVLIMALAVTLLLTATGPLHAQVSTPEIEAKQAQLDEAQAYLGGLSDEMSIAVEEYNAVSEALEKTRGEIAGTQQALEEARERVREAQGALSDRAQQIYKFGDMGVIEVLLGTRSFEDLLVRLDWLTRVSSQDTRVLVRVRDAREEVSSLLRTLEVREAEQVALRDEASSQKAHIEALISRQEAYVGALSQDVKTLIAEEEERQRRLAEERARLAAEAARRAAEAASLAATGFPDADPNAGPGRPEVVGIALQYLGIPYQWGGSSPNTGFDCSGLTQFVFAQAGIELPRTSRSQFQAGSRISEAALDQLVLGDLVFFGYDGDPNRVHHVGIYCGSGNFVHAPNTGDVVKVSSLAERIAEKDDYVGASRF